MQKEVDGKAAVASGDSEPSVDGVLGKLSRRQYGTVQRKLSAAVARVRSEAFRDMLLQRLEAVKALREKTGAAA